MVRSGLGYQQYLTCLKDDQCCKEKYPIPQRPEDKMLNVLHQGSHYIFVL
jgi:hypothetical protein